MTYEVYLSNTWVLYCYIVEDDTFNMDHDWCFVQLM